MSKSARRSRSGRRAPFWTRVPLADMTLEQWESLCDGCGRCCLHKLQDADSGETFYTDVACRLLDINACRCTAYAHRHELVPDCVRLTRRNLARLKWMPSTCAYRLIYEGKALPSWHPLVTGDPESVHRAGVSVRGKAVAEQHVDVRELEARLVEWVRSRARLP